MKRLKLICLLASVMGAATFVAIAAQPTLEQAMAAPAVDLARGYLSARFMSEFLRHDIGDGVTIQLPGETITKSNVNDYRQRYQERLSIYREAIRRRGYRTISGVYRGMATEACARIGSDWVDAIRVGRATRVEIIQHDFDVELVVDTGHDEEKTSFRNQGAIAESSIVIQDEWNSDYFFLGAAGDKEIQIKPDVSVLRNWPEWAGPPSRKDLENCTMTLEPIAH